MLVGVQATIPPRRSLESGETLHKEDQPESKAGKT